MPQDEQALDELRAACTAGRLDEVEEMFNTGRMSAEDASKALEEAVNDLAILRCLLEHGADPQALELRVVKSIETLKLLAGYGYDFEKQGHLILQYGVHSYIEPPNILMRTQRLCRRSRHSRMVAATGRRHQ